MSKIRKYYENVIKGKKKNVRRMIVSEVGGSLLRLRCAPVRGTARAVWQYRWQYRTKVDFALRLLVMFPIYDRT